MSEDRYETRRVRQIRLAIESATELCQQYGCEAVDIPDLYLNGISSASVDVKYRDLFSDKSITEEGSVFAARGFRFVWRVLENNWKGRLYVLSRSFNVENATCPEFYQLDIAMILADGSLAVAKTIANKIVAKVTSNSGLPNGQFIQHSFLSPCVSVSVSQRDEASKSLVGLFGIVRPELLEHFGINPDKLVSMYFSFNIDSLAMSCIKVDEE